jgi:hypothetical protein
MVRTGGLLARDAGVSHPTRYVGATLMVAPVRAPRLLDRISINWNPPVGWVKARSCAPCPPRLGPGGHASLCSPYYDASIRPKRALAGTPQESLLPGTVRRAKNKPGGTRPPGHLECGPRSVRKRSRLWVWRERRIGPSAAQQIKCHGNSLVVRVPCTVDFRRKVRLRTPLFVALGLEVAAKR